MTLTDTKEIESLRGLFLQIIQRNLTPEAFAWLETKAGLVKAEEGSMQLSLTFAHLPRLAAKKPVSVETAENEQIDQLLPGFSITGWTTDKLCRVWILMQVPDTDPVNYLKKINGLFAAAEMNEQVALYSALPLLSYPQEWIARCEDGIRSNIGTVLEAIMYHNPYPAAYLPQPSWNQLVLKAFFTEKDVNKIIGFKERANAALTATLQDYVQERLAAQRSVHPEIYKLIELTN
ncbi:EboA domain-containing protein [Pedobacter metabolipauper]|uniref:Uncharacterized protein n=1 Tax=Pedobacter metabolipauper TaxID=425513 RepID=A0A4R6SQX6_9SPHI|nr:EboA domain-containing protein [Pedobacter metabolipauper]TDQ06700.1 hypothetical protein ATK78_4359 [Pedobacter metabolipauper]